MTNDPKPPRCAPPPPRNLDEATAEVASEAGKSLLRGIGRLTGAAVAKWIATKEAEAEAAAMAIKTMADIDRERARGRYRRESELSEVEHGGFLQRRLERLKHELAREQSNLEAIEIRALDFVECSAARDNAREIGEDWIFAFARYAQAASEVDIQDLWSRILGAAAIEGGQRLSAAALQAMSLIDRQLALDLRKLCSAITAFGFFPAHDDIFDCGAETQRIDVLSLKELGLIQEDPLSGAYAFSDFELRIGPLPGKRIGLLHTSFSLTRRGTEIANAVFHGEDLSLPKEIEQKYLEDLISHQIARYMSMDILPPPQPGEAISPLAVRLLYPRGPKPVRHANLDTIESQVSERIRRLIGWAGTMYDLELVSTLAVVGRN